MLNAFKLFELSLVNFIQSYRSPVLDAFFIRLGFLTELAFLWIVILTFIYIISPNFRRLTAAGFFSLLLYYVYISPLKAVVNRPRPYLSIPDAGSSHISGLGIIQWANGSFPSGHAYSSFAAAYVLARMFPDYKLLFYGLAALAAFSRIYCGMHYLTDVLAGAFLGWITAYLVVELIEDNSSAEG